MDYRLALTEISELIGTAFAFKGFCVKLRSGEEYRIQNATELNITCGEHGVTMTGVLGEIDFSWHMYMIGSMYKVWMELTAENEISAERIDSFILDSQVYQSDRVAVNDSILADIYNVSDMPEEKQSIFCAGFLTGIYSPENSGTGITLITAIPMKFSSDYILTKSDDRIKTVFSTYIPDSYKSCSVISEKTCVFNYMSMNSAIEAFWQNVHGKNNEYKFEKPIGWSSWDYYYSSVTLDDMIENMEQILSDDVLKERIEYIAVDDGWEHREGDWYPNYRFPGGTKKLADEIIKRGFKPGIWIVPTNMHDRCGTVQRHNSFIIRNDIGDPISINNMYIVDPTHPDGEAHIRKIFTALKEEGYKFFKVDFVQYLLKCSRFYDTSVGQFDVIRRLFSIIRECVGDDSHIMGCGTHIGIGEGYVDSRRTGVDIHNYWSHIVMCTNVFAVQYAQHRKVYQNDVDYLVVRGNDTSFEENTTVLNPLYNKLKDSKAIEWCAGRVFTYDEAKTWCTLELASGSSIFLGDRLSALNDVGIDLVRRTVEKADFEAAIPVDLTSENMLTVWRAKESGRIYVVNWSDDNKAIDIEANGSYSDIFTDKAYLSNDNIIRVTLRPHESAALELR